MKHTQGKWLQKQVKANDRPGKVTLIHTDYKDGHLGVATVNWTDDEEGQANANLIASAPELLKACKRARQAIGGARRGANPAQSEIEQLNKVIAKAEGK